MLDGHQHALFRAFPIAGTVAVSAGNLPPPYHVYDGHGLLITGHAQAAALTQAFAGQDVFPVLTDAGHAAMGLFIGHFTDTSLGPHLQLQAVALCAPTPGARISNARTAMLAALASRPDWSLLNRHLWTDSAVVVTYNTEYLGMQAALATGEIAHNKRLSFAFHDAQGALASGDLRLNPMSDLRAIWGLMRQIGLHQTQRLARQPFARLHMVHHSTRTQTLTAADRRVVTRFDPKRDRLTLSGPLAAYDFQPLICEHLSPFRHVHLAA